MLLVQPIDDRVQGEEDSLAKLNRRQVLLVAQPADRLFWKLAVQAKQRDHVLCRQQVGMDDIAGSKPRPTIETTCCVWLVGWGASPTFFCSLMLR